MTEGLVPGLDVAAGADSRTPVRDRMVASAPDGARRAHGTVFVRPVVFLGGVTSVGVELSTSRLIAPYFGSSTFIWANLIGLTLTFLALGYWLGGRLADRSPRPEILYTVTMAAACSVGLIPVMSRPVLSAALRAFDTVDIGAFYGALVGVLLLLAVPVTLLGFVTPYAIRLQLDRVAAAGQTAGSLYALSTLGSIVGSFLPVLVLIPLVGTAKTFLLLALTLLGPSALALLWTRSSRRAIISLVLAAGVVTVNLAGASSRIKPAYRGQLVYETESDSNYIQVLNDDGRFLLALNEGHAIHSIYDPDELLTQGPWDYFMVAPLFLDHIDQAPVQRALLIGLAGGTAVRQLTAAYGPIPIDGVEIDPEIARVGRRYFGLDAPGLQNVHVIIQDGRYVLRTTDRRYDLVGVDAYRQPYIPFQLTTKEFFDEVSDHLRPGGTAVVNVGRTDTDFRLVDAIASTMASVYTNVFIIDVERYSNSMVIGTNAPASVSAFSANTNRLPPQNILRTVGERAIATGSIRQVHPGGRVFTDDWAPVESVVDQIILDEARRESHDGP
jgi:predicted membrane-bound spermidine synthase